MTQAYLRNLESLRLSSLQLNGLMDEVLSLGLPFRFKAGGGSMFPFIRDGDVISVTPLAGRIPGVGAVVAYLRIEPDHPNRSHLVVHRLIKRNPDGCMLLGDNQLPDQIEGPIANECILAVVSSVERRGRAVRLGFGPERFAIAVLSQFGLLHPLVHLAGRVRHCIQNTPS